MSRTLSCILTRCAALVVAVLLLQPSLAQGEGEGRRLYVSPAGDDAWSGARAEPRADQTDGPLATLQRAQQIVRKWNADGPPTPITVLLREGTYRLSEPLVFTPADSGTEAFPVSYQAYPGERPVVSGGLPISGWQTEGRLWRTEVPRLASGETWRFNQLFVNGQRRTRARTPNRGESPGHPLRFRRGPTGE